MEKEMNFLFNVNVCRVCMQSEQSNNLLSDELLLEKFEFTTRLAIAKNDNLPKSICSKCSTRLKVAYEFIKTAQDSENNLKAFLEKINTDFKEVSQGNKSVKRQTHDENLTEDELLSLMHDENHKNIERNAGLSEKRKTLSCTDYKIKRYKLELEDNKARLPNDPNSVIKLKEENIDHFKNDQNVYRLSESILIINDGRSEIDNEIQCNSHFMEIAEQEEENERESRSLSDEAHDDILEPGVHSLVVSDEIESQSQSSDFGIEDSEENQDYVKLINGQTDDLKFSSVYADENSVEDVNSKAGTYYITHINENISNIGQENTSSDITISEEQKESVRAISVKKESHGNRFYCQKCNRDFSTKTNLNRHMQSHEGNKPFTCTECRKSFTQKSTLKQHMYTHTGERPYVCEVCNRGFTQCKSLIFHMRRHTGEKPFHCEYCLITFRQKDALRIHILKHHVVIEQSLEGTDLFTCIICQKKFDTKTEFKTHMKVHTAGAEVDNVLEFIKDEQEGCLTSKIKQKGPTNLLLPVESECFDAAVVDVSASSAAEPSRAKKFQCRKCFKCFALKKSLLRHMRIHFVDNENDFSECLDCDLQFSSREFYQEHLIECHQYACSSCPGKIFKTIEELKVHMFEHDLDQQE